MWVSVAWLLMHDRRPHTVIRTIRCSNESSRSSSGDSVIPVHTVIDRRNPCVTTLTSCLFRAHTMTRVWDVLIDRLYPQISIDDVCAQIPRNSPRYPSQLSIERWHCSFPGDSVDCESRYLSRGEYRSRTTATPVNSSTKPSQKRDSQSIGSIVDRCRRPLYTQ